MLCIAAGCLTRDRSQYRWSHRPDVTYLCDTKDCTYKRTRTILLQHIVKRDLKYIIQIYEEYCRNSSFLKKSHIIYHIVFVSSSLYILNNLLSGYNSNNSNIIFYQIYFIRSVLRFFCVYSFFILFIYFYISLLLRFLFIFLISYLYCIFSSYIRYLK